MTARHFIRSLAWIAILSAAKISLAQGMQRLNAGPVESMAQIVRDLPSTDVAVRHSAVEALVRQSETDNRFGQDIATWADLLFATRDYENTVQIAQMAVLRRALDSAVVQKGERLRATAMLAQGINEQSLQEAKAYYNAAALADTADAITILAGALATFKDAAAADDFRAEQAHMPADVKTPKQSKTLNSISIPQDRYDFALQYLQGRPASYLSFISQGNYCLISDRGDEAGKDFESACKVATHKSKQIRMAVEGIARAIRAVTGNPAAANAYILSLRQTDSTAAADLLGSGADQGDSPSVDEVRSAAGAVKLASLSSLVPSTGNDQQ